MSDTTKLLRREVAALAGGLAGLWSDLDLLDARGPRARQCATTTLAVTISVMVASALRIEDPWWAAISGYMAVQATRPASLSRAILRVSGTVGGALAGFVAARFVIADPVAGSLAVLTAAMAALIGSSVSRFGYAWLLGGITANMVVLTGFSDPAAVLPVAVYRTMEVAIGVGAALLVTTLFSPEGEAASAVAAARPTDLFGADWEAVGHALRLGLVVMVMPFLWSWLNLPGLSQMAITVTAVMAVPLQPGRALANAQLVVSRSLQRLAGCLLGGLAALLVLALSIDSFPFWLAALALGIWICTHLQTSPGGFGYVGIQAAIVFIVTAVQGFGPPTSVVPGLERLVGISVGIAVLLASLIVWPPREERGA